MNNITIYLIGVFHEIQHHKETDSHNKTIIINDFIDYLIKNIKKYNITLLAEEFSEEVAEKNNIKESVLFTVSTKLKIHHQYCDPDTDERISNNISDDGKREDFWLKRLETENHKNILFLCGNDHIKSFSHLLSDNKFQVIILKEECGKELHSPLFE